MSVSREFNKGDVLEVFYSYGHAIGIYQGKDDCGNHIIIGLEQKRMNPDGDHFWQEIEGNLEFIFDDNPNHIYVEVISHGPRKE